MIDFGGYYYIQESDIVAIERVNVAESDPYPFRLVVHTRNELSYSVRYASKAGRDKAADNMAKGVEQATRNRDMEQIFNKLWLLDAAVSKLDRRQLKIWRQLKALLGLTDKEEVSGHEKG